jgi:DNA/RNA-binding domain of Phe-tRNA-synthetase-like protein
MPETRIGEQIFEKFPSFRRGIVVARKMDNRGLSKELEILLNEALSGAATAPIDLTADPRTAVWNETYRELGCNPNKFPPSHLALLKWIQKPGVSLPFINKAVAIMNDNSIRRVLPVGGDDFHRAGEILELRPAEGSERFTPLNDPGKTEHPDPGEIIYVVAETQEVMCRR